jgi:hypothetical protein
MLQARVRGWQSVPFWLRKKAVAPSKPITLPPYAKRCARWLGLWAWLAAQSCVGPDLEPPGTNASAPVAPAAGAAGSRAVDTAEAPGRMSGAGGAKAADDVPATSKDAGVDDAGSEDAH